MIKVKRMLPLSLLVVAFTLVIGIGSASASLVDAVLNVTADNVIAIWLNDSPTALSPGANAGNWQIADTYNISLNWLGFNYLTFLVNNDGYNSAQNPAGLLASISLVDSSQHFAETGTNTILSTSADYWSITPGLVDSVTPTSWASNDYGTYGGATDVWWKANGYSPVSGIDGQAEWIWTANNLVTGGDNRGFISVNMTPVPEPSSMMLLGFGLLGMAGFARRKFSSK